jgi:hypothetical protein
MDAQDKAAVVAAIRVMQFLHKCDETEGKAGGEKEIVNPPCVVRQEAR